MDSMQNYTDIGFLKTRAPKQVIELATKFWEQNHLNMEPESWPVGNTYINNWVSPTYMLKIEDRRLRGGGFDFRERLWAAARESIEDWTGEDLSPTSLYGIRVYREGAVLLPHVDRLPLVASAMVNIAQDVDEPWPMEIYDHDGQAHNITLDPGDMLLFESHSAIHGRPFPLKGRFYAMLFIHFEPTGAVPPSSSTSNAGVTCSISLVIAFSQKSVLVSLSMSTARVTEVGISRPYF